MQLERAQLFRGRGVGGMAEKGREPLDGTDVLALRIGHETAHVHVFEHALAQRADGLLAHWGAPVLRLECLTPRSSRRSARPSPAFDQMITVPDAMRPTSP